MHEINEEELYYLMAEVSERGEYVQMMYSIVQSINVIRFRAI